MKMFERVRAAVEALNALTSVEDYHCGNPLLSTEVYNEGWMLRLVVAKLCDTPEKVLRALADAKENAAIRDIARLGCRGWCSEGELYPTFEGEGKTKADGLVGDIRLREIGAERTAKWGFECDVGEFRVLEAKMKSPLSAGTKNLSHYDQAARYVGCIAMMEARQPDDVKGGLIVLGPKSKRDGVESKILNAEKTIRGVRCPPRDRDVFQRAQSLISGVVGRSAFVSWENILDALPKDCETSYIYAYYNKALIANDP